MSILVHSGSLSQAYSFKLVLLLVLLECAGLEATLKAQIYSTYAGKKGNK